MRRLLLLALLAVGGCDNPPEGGQAHFWLPNRVKICGVEAEGNIADANWVIEHTIAAYEHAGIFDEPTMRRKLRGLHIYVVRDDKENQPFFYRGVPMAGLTSCDQHAVWLRDRNWC